MKRRKNSWLAYCLVCIMAMGLIFALVGCDGNADTAAPEYKVTIASGITGGSIDATPKSAKRGAEITVTVTPETTPVEYRLKTGSLKYGSTLISEATKKFNMPAANVTITAQFETIPTVVDPDATYDVVTAGGITGGTISVTGITEGKAGQNATITVTANPASGNQLKAGSLKYTYEENGETVTVILGTNPAQFYLPPGDVTITAEFEVKPAAGQFTVTIDPGITNGTVTASPTAAAQGTQITITATANEGYRLQAGSLKRGNSLTQMSTAINNNRFNMPSRNVFVTAIFETEGPDLNYDKYRDELLAIIADMSLDEKIGQMTQAERGQLSYGATHPYADQVKNYFLGSVLSGGESGPGNAEIPASGNNGNTSPLRWWQFNNRMLEASMQNPPKGGMSYGIPFVYGIDAVHGHGNAIQNPTIFPHNIGMGAIAVGDPEKGKKAGFDAGAVTAAEMYATGHRFNFNPVLGVGENSSWGRMYESYSQNPDIVAMMGAEYVKGIQNAGLVGACGKHYGFEGQVTSSSSVTSGNAQVGDLASPENRAKIMPYKAAIDAGLLSVMTFYGQVNGNAPVRYKELLDILKVDWGFKGFMITDWSNMGTGSANIRDSVNAGIDMNMAASAGEWQAFISTLRGLVNSGDVSLDRIDDAVYRILLFKKVFGILDNPVVEQPDPFPNGSAENRLVSRNIAAQTLVLLKNKDDIVGKLSEKTNILLTGDASAHIGYQCGGWTRAWQGVTTATIPDFSGTNIYDGMNAALSEKAGVTLQRNATGAVVANFTPDVIIAVVCETPYAEGSGDASAPAIGNADTGKGRAADATMLNNVYNNYPNVPVILIVLSGRPVNLITSTTTSGVTTTRDNYALCDGIIAAWLPGSEAGDAIADVLFRDKDFVGKTPMDWRLSPRTGNIVFPYGWGLKKGETGTPQI